MSDLPSSGPRRPIRSRPRPCLSNESPPHPSRPDRAHFVDCSIECGPERPDRGPGRAGQPSGGHPRQPPESSCFSRPAHLSWPRRQGGAPVGGRVRRAAARFHRLRVRDRRARSRLVRRGPRGRARSADSIATCRRSATPCRRKRSRWRSSHVRTFCADRRGRAAISTFRAPSSPRRRFRRTKRSGRRRGRRGREPRSATTLVYERRFGARNQIEIAAPIDFQQGAGRRLDARARRRRASPSSGRVTRAIEHGRIVPRGVEVVLPTGEETLRARQRRTPSSSRSRCGDRCCPATRSCRCTAESSCRRTRPERARELFLRTASAPRSRRIAASAAPGRRRSKCCGPGRRASASEWDVVPQCRSRCRSSSTSCRRRRPYSADPARGAADAGAGLSALGLVRRRLLRVLEMSAAALTLVAAHRSWFDACAVRARCARGRSAG